MQDLRYILRVFLVGVLLFTPLLERAFVLSLHVVKLHVVKLVPFRHLVRITDEVCWIRRNRSDNKQS